jgi:DNA-binding MarR family transcriptional regulator
MNEKMLANKIGVFATLINERMVADFGALSSSSAAALLTLFHHGPMTATRLGAIVGVTQSASTRQIDKLIGEGLVERVGKKEGREVKFLLSALGQVQAENLQAARLAASGDLLAALNPVERRHLDRILSRLLAVSVTDRAQARHLCRFCDHGLCDGDACVVGKAATRLEHQEQTA